MVDTGDRSALRTLVGEVVARLGGQTHARLNLAFEQLGTPPVSEDAGTKRERVDLSFRQVPESELPQVTRRILEQRDIYVQRSAISSKTCYRQRTHHPRYPRRPAVSWRAPSTSRS
ncbi:hypothetical protein [Streptomyces sp. NPDC096193]|uniref:hypothetical protein n=1 Tax=Streptomyces sp. NPDC096193 TaxID=3155821 RepID=UPI00332147AC